MTEEIKCIFWKNGRCNSDYGNGIKCDGINPPEGCPYSPEKLEIIAMEIEEVKMKTKGWFDVRSG